MNTILQEIKILPGVIGSFVFIKDTGVAYSNLPDSFTEEMTTDAANNVGRMLQMADIKGLDPQSVCIKYDKFNLLTMPINETVLLLTLCDPNNSTALVSTTICMLAPELDKSVVSFQQSGPTGLEEPPLTSPPESVPPPEIDEQKTNDALAHIKDSLFGTVGPIADIIFDDCLEKWTSDNPADVSRISELIGYFSEEIDNPELFEEFKEKIVSLL